jgi:hypothetical protein
LEQGRIATLSFQFIRKAIKGTIIIIEEFHSNIDLLSSRMTPYANEIIGEYQCGFRRHTSAGDHKAFGEYLKRNGNSIRGIPTIYRF